jgi:hypothetical protein
MQAGTIDRREPILELGQLLLADEGTGRKKGRPIVYTVSFVGKTMAKLVANVGCMSIEVKLRGNRLPGDWQVINNYSLAQKLYDDMHPPNPAP